MKREAKKSQAGLEYLIILAAVIMIASAAVYTISKNASENRESLLIKTCQNAAAQCNLMKMVSATMECSICDIQCIDYGLDLITKLAPSDLTGAVGCCKKGNLIEIYAGSQANCA